MKYWYNCDKCDHRNILEVPMYYQGQRSNIIEYMCEECGHHIGFIGHGSLQFYNKKMNGPRYGLITERSQLFEYVHVPEYTEAYTGSSSNYVSITYGSTTTSPINYRIV